MSLKRFNQINKTTHNRVVFYCLRFIKIIHYSKRIKVINIGLLIKYTHGYKMFKSVESLIATNNGFFKSEKQANFLIAQLSSEHGNIQVGSTYGNSFMITYFHDEKGITKKEQYNYKTSKTLVLWERVVAGKLSIQQEKELKKLQSKLKKSIKSLESRVEGRSEYPDYINQVADNFTGDKEEYCKWLESLNEKGIESDKSDIEFLESKINEILS